MTDAEIIKGTECCSSKKIVCADCPYYDSYNCVQNLGKDTIDLINRQKAEIERLTINMNAFGLGMKREKERADTAKAEIERLKKGWKADVIESKNTKTEAIKEFAERLKERFLSLEYRPNTTRKTLPLASVKDQIKWIMHKVSIETIDNLVKEMVGDG